MHTADARTLIERFTAWSDVPALTVTEVDDLVSWAADGSSFDVYGAVAVGWEWKAAKVAGGYDFGRGDQSWSRSQMFRHCQQQAAYYRARSSGIVAAATGVTTASTGLGTIEILPSSGLAYLVDEDGELTRVARG